MLPEGVTAIDDAGATMAAFGYNDAITEVIPRLTELLGFSPIVVIHERRPSDAYFIGTEYQWEGLNVFWSGFEDEEVPATDEADALYPRIHVTFSAAAVRGVALYGPSSLQIGGDFAAAAALYPEYSHEFTDSDGVVHVSLHAAVIPAPASPYNDGSFLMGAAVASNDGSGLITSIAAPSQVNYGL